VVLFDISAGLLSFAKDKLQAEPEAVRSRLLDYVEGDVQDLSRFEADSFDAVMCLGPLTHIPAEAGRNKALSELVRVARPGAVVFIGVGGYLAVLRTILAEFSDELLPPSFQTLVQTGDDLVGVTGTVWHFFRADELRRCAEGCGLQTLALAGCQGLSAGLVEATNAIAQDEAKWRRWTELVIQTSAEAAVADMAEHILYVGRAVKAERPCPLFYGRRAEPNDNSANSALSHYHYGRLWRGRLCRAVENPFFQWSQ
jgi:SAM-dependent methyltransferase